MFWGIHFALMSLFSNMIEEDVFPLLVLVRLLVPRLRLYVRTFVKIHLRDARAVNQLSLCVSGRD